MKGSIVLIGSGEDCAIRLSGPHVALHHARIEEEGGRHVIVALDPGHPLRVNETMVSRQPLRSGDRVTIGEFELEYHPALPPRARRQRQTARRGGGVSWILVGLFIVLQMIVLGLLNYMYLTYVVEPRVGM